MMLGRYSRLILDSWTRPTYAQLVGKPSVADEEIEERFSSYGPYKGLAFWLYLTRGWIEEDRPAALRGSECHVSDVSVEGRAFRNAVGRSVIAAAGRF
jgi:hypothetical protein